MRNPRTLAAALCALAVCVCQPAINAQRGPAAAAAAQQSFHLIANANITAPAATFLSPANPLVPETVTGPALFTVPITADRSRSYLMLVVNCSFNMHQIPTGVPLQFVSGFNVRLASAALPAPGFVDVIGFGSGIILHGGTTVSNDDITTNTPFQRTLFYDAGIVAPSIQTAFPALTADEAAQLAATLLQSALTITVTPSVTMQSVQNVRYSPLRLMQVFGD